MDLKEKVLEAVQSESKQLKEVKDYLYAHPETGGFEENSSKLLIDNLKGHGFEVTTDIHDIKYSFRAVYEGAKSGPTIGIMCEYDALPESGHSCGHNIICTMSLGAAYGLKPAVDALGGRVIVYGTPGEECLVTKAQMSVEHVFDECDVAIMAHPNPIGMTSGETMGIDALQIEFHGVSSHAGAAPEDGKNALDAAVLCYSAIGFEKQYLPGTNIYGIINEGGKKASAIPDYASLKYLLRAKNGLNMKKANEMVVRCAENAARMTETTVHIFNNEPSNKEMVTNSYLSEAFNRSYEEVTGEALLATDSNGSTDMGDVSYVVPAIHPWVSLHCPDTQLHNITFAGHTVAPEGDKLMVDGGKSLALTGLEVLSSPELLANIKAEFKKWKEERGF